MCSFQSARSDGSPRDIIENANALAHTHVSIRAQRRIAARLNSQRINLDLLKVSIRAQRRIAARRLRRHPADRKPHVSIRAQRRIAARRQLLDPRLNALAVSIRAQRRIAARPSTSLARAGGICAFQSARSDGSPRDLNCRRDQAKILVSIRAQRRIAARRMARTNRAPRCEVSIRAQRRIAARLLHAIAVNGSTLFQSARSDGSPRDRKSFGTWWTTASFNPRAATDRRATSCA